MEKEKACTQHRIKLIAWLKPTYESPRGLSICDLFANFIAETRNEIIHKTVVLNAPKNRIDS